MSKAGKNIFEIDVLKEKLCEQEQLVRKQALRIAALEEQLQLSRHKRFGASSEKADADQLNLFNEAEATTDTSPDEEAADTTTIPEHKRKKRGRRAIDENLRPCEARLRHDALSLSTTSQKPRKPVLVANTKRASVRKHRNNSTFLFGRLRLPDSVKDSGAQACPLQICLPLLRRHRR